MTLDVGYHENQFWIAMGDVHMGANPDWPIPGSGKYFKIVDYAHIRTDGSSPGMQRPDLAEQPRFWEAHGAHYLDRWRDSYFKPLDQEPLRLWEPCLTHRMMAEPFTPWTKIVDPETGLPKYMMLSRRNHTIDYGEFGKKASFLPPTYAYGLPGLENLYVKPLAAFLAELGKLQRKNPELIELVEPNHEHEIHVSEDKSIGDYNPKMIEGYAQYLARFYGTDLAQLNKTLGADFKENFDASRKTKIAVHGTATMQKILSLPTGVTTTATS